MIDFTKCNFYVRVVLKLVDIQAKVMGRYMKVQKKDHYSDTHCTHPRLLTQHVGVASVQWAAVSSSCRLDGGT